MDHRSFLKTLTPEQRASLLELSDAKGLKRLAGHWGAILVFGVLINQGVPGWQLLLIPQGILLIFCFTLLHETIHDTAFKTRALNRIVGHICSLVLFLPMEWFRFFHLAHHRFTNDPANDPELTVPKPATRWQYVRHVSGIPVWLFQLRRLISNALRDCTDRFVPTGARARIKSEARVMLGLFALAGLSLASGQTWLFWCWLLPIALGQPFLRLFLLAEHGRCPTVADMFENSRTTFTTALVRFLAWNMPYHAEHHTYPSVPFHRLPQLHRLTQAHLKTTEDGYTRFHRAYVGQITR